MPIYYSASQAAARLGVSRQTLYSYVSRGLLRANPGESHRDRRYLIAEVDQLATRRQRARSPARAARNALSWGLPVVESSICCIDAGRLYYRGKDVLSLIEAKSAEEVAALLWQCDRQEAFAATAPASARPSRPVPSRSPRRPARPPSRLPAFEPNTASWLLSSFATAARELPSDYQHTATARSARLYGDVVRILAGHVLRVKPSAEPLRKRCAEAWNLTTGNARLLETALILCADHELNASSFTVRCIASTGASLHACTLGGLAALSGPLHGGMTLRVENLWNEFERASNPVAILRARLESGEHLPGFGHPLYPDGDIRATAILERLRGRGQRWRPLAQAVEQLTGLRPSIDFALVALRRHLDLPPGSAFGIFALGRSIGWIAHALEQREVGTLIRPRASYTGPSPEPLAR
jgi:citrate synthase